MALVINTNVMSLNAQRNLSTSGSQLATSLQRLSSGLRINSAKDDAAGLAISERMTTQIRGLNQAARNANDGISLAQTDEGALAGSDEQPAAYPRAGRAVRQRDEQRSDRDALNQEVQQRIAEIDRIATQTSFNGRKVLDGSFGGATFQVGANVGETISLALTSSVKATAIGQVATSTGTVDLQHAVRDGARLPRRPARSAAPARSRPRSAARRLDVTDRLSTAALAVSCTAITLPLATRRRCCDRRRHRDDRRAGDRRHHRLGTAAAGTTCFSSADGTDFDDRRANGHGTRRLRHAPRHGRQRHSGSRRYAGSATRSAVDHDPGRHGTAVDCRWHVRDGAGPRGRDQQPGHGRVCVDRLDATTW